MLICHESPKCHQTQHPLQEKLGLKPENCFLTWRKVILTNYLPPAHPQKGPCAVKTLQIASFHQCTQGNHDFLYLIWE